LERIVALTGTPTLVWRRTGEIVLVNAEFCALTGWTKKQMLAEFGYLHHLLTAESLISYWELFAMHAMANSELSVKTHCKLISGNLTIVEGISCAFCFTIKRDLFDLPMMIVGNFLPVLR